MVPELEFLTGPQAGWRVALDKDSMTFGSAQHCDVVLFGEGVEPFHGRIYRHEGRWYLTDFVDQAPQMQDGFPVGSMPARIANKDIIQFGEVRLMLHDPEPTAEDIQLYPHKRRPDMIRTWNQTGAGCVWWLNVLSVLGFLCCLASPIGMVIGGGLLLVLGMLFILGGGKTQDKHLVNAAVGTVVIGAIAAILGGVMLAFGSLMP